MLDDLTAAFPARQLLHATSTLIRFLLRPKTTDISLCFPFEPNSASADELGAIF